MTKFRVIDGGKAPPRKKKDHALAWTIAGAVAGALIAPVIVTILAPLAPYLIAFPVGVLLVWLAIHESAR